MTPITIVLADDHALVRLGLRAILDVEPTLRIVGEAIDGPEVLPLVERLQPDVLVLDLTPLRCVYQTSGGRTRYAAGTDGAGLPAGGCPCVVPPSPNGSPVPCSHSVPGLRGLETIRKVVRRAPRTRVVVISMYASQAHVATALCNGAAGYAVVESDASEVVRAIREVAAGRGYVSSPMSAAALMADFQSAYASTQDALGALTARELEVLQLSAEGCTSAACGARLFISARTVETHRANLMRKLRLKTQAELIRYAISCGVVPLRHEPSPHKPDREFAARRAPNVAA